MWFRLSLFALLAFVVPTAGQTVAAGAITVDGTAYSLWGIQLPPRGQVCSKDFAADEEAAEALSELIEGKTVTCEPRDKDRTGRTTAVCRADGVDLGAALVRSGMAWAQLGLRPNYVLEEAKAAAEHLGVHAHHCRHPDFWRGKDHSSQTE